MEVEEYLGKSRLYLSLTSGPHGQLVERYAARLVEERLARQGTWRCLNVVGGLLSWSASRGWALAERPDYAEWKGTDVHAPADGTTTTVRHSRTIRHSSAVGINGDP